MSGAEERRYRTSEGFFPIPAELADWSTHVYDCGEESEVRFFIHRNRHTDPITLAERVVGAARRGLKRVELLKHERVTLACGWGVLVEYTFDGLAGRSFESKLVFECNGTCFVALAEARAPRGQAARAVLGEFARSMRLRAKEN